MSPELMFLVGTLFAWIGWVLLALTVYRGLASAILPKGVARQPNSRALLTSAAGAAVCLMLGYTAAANPGHPVSGFRIPIVWIVMPFAGWASIACLTFGLSRLYTMLLSAGTTAMPELTAKRQKSMLTSTVAWIAAALLFFTILKKSGDPVSIIRGAVELSASVALSLATLFVVAFLVMCLAERAARTRGVAKAIASHLLLLIGSVIFGIPFLWALITSFKEDLDMSSPNGLVWIPHVKVTTPYRDPQNPLYKLKFQDLDAEATLVDKEPDGKLKLEIQRPKVLLGQTAIVKPQEATEIDREADVVTGSFNGAQIKGMDVKDLEDGRKTIRISEPANLAGTEFIANPTDVDNVRVTGLRWKNYPEALEYLPPEANNGLVYLKNTLILVLLSVLGTVLSSSLVAYAFSRLNFPGKKLAFLVLLSTMMLPAAVTLMPTFLIFKSFGWIDTLLPLWVPTFFASAFNVFLLRQFFITIPMELEDASKIDGCNYLKSFWSVMLPQVKPALAVITVWTFVGVWNNFMGPLIYINSPEKMTVSYALQLFQGDRFGEPGLLMAFATMGMVPVIALFFLAQRYFIEGVTLSGLGGR